MACHTQMHCAVLIALLLSSASALSTGRLSAPSTHTQHTTALGSYRFRPCQMYAISWDPGLGAAVLAVPTLLAPATVGAAIMGHNNARRTARALTEQALLEQCHLGEPQTEPLCIDEYCEDMRGDLSFDQFCDERTSWIRGLSEDDLDKLLHRPIET